MRFLVVALLIALGGCGEIPSYVVRPQHTNSTTGAVPAVRERDGQAVLLRGGSFMPTNDPPLPDGGVRVRGPGRRGVMWKTGIALTAVGWTLAITGAVIGIIGFEKSLGPCKLFEPCGSTPTPDQDLGDRMLVGGLVIGPIGDVLTIIGPIVASVGARQRPVELP